MAVRRIKTSKPESEFDKNLERELNRFSTEVSDKLSGATGSFTTVDLKTVTVVDGIITNIT